MEGGSSWEAAAEELLSAGAAAGRLSLTKDLGRVLRMVMR